MLQKDYDIVIVGAGISCLLLASELIKNHSIIVIDKNEDIPINKYWLTSQDVLMNNNLKPLLDCIDTYYSHMDFIAYNGYKYRCEGRYVLWDSEKLVMKLSKIFLSEGGKYLFSHKFYSYSCTKNDIVVKANNKSIKAKLLIDCMGFESPIAVANDLLKIEGYYILHGGKYKLRRNVDPICLANIMLNKNAKYLEIFPTSNNYAYTTILYPSLNAINDENVQSDFNFLINKSEFSTYFEHLEPHVSKIGGIVPVGKLKKNSLDRIFLYGESAQMNPSATGTCLTKLFNNYLVISNYLSDMISQNTLKQDDLNYTKRDNTTKFNKRFQLQLYEEVLKWNSKDFLFILSQLDSSTNQIVNDILFENLKLRSLINTELIKSTVKNGKYYVFYLLLKSLFKNIN